ncbi:FAD:protein FMN transferase [Nakamurella flava]|uniref:FAD:protein FMN transferase n=2 Tax=Nakamurella flava TaxID=2576308 RepID=A0A4U6QN79_9ACTN|nr:FAD:protein FMN transferase [Nakamurella flava]
MPVSLALRGRHTDDAAADSAWIRVVQTLREIDLTFSTYRPDSTISRLGRGQIALDDCPAEVREVLALGERAEQESGGAFSVRLPGPDGRTRLDPSGVVKGWAVDRAARHLDELTATDYCLSAGGDMLCRTVRPGAAPWRIGIEDPSDPTRVLAVVPVLDGGVATSGTTHRGAHLVDARTGATPDAVASVTVVAATVTDADIDATAAYARGPDAATWLRRRPGRSGLVVWRDGSLAVFGPSSD